MNLFENSPPFLSHSPRGVTSHVDLAIWRALADSDFLDPLRIGSAADDLPGKDLLDRLKANVKEDQPFELLVRIKLKPGTEARFAAEAAKVAKATAAEPGNEMFVFFQHLEQPGTVILFEKWKNIAALQVSPRAAPHHSLAQVHRRHRSRGDDRHPRAARLRRNRLPDRERQAGPPESVPDTSSFFQAETL